MKYLVDTTLIIDHVAGKRAATDLFRDLVRDGHQMFVCDVVVCESLSGGPDDQRAAVIALLAELEYFSTGTEAARWAGDGRRRRGRTSPRTLGDALIAGVAWVNGATIVTRNPDDFVAQGIPVLAYA